MTNIQKIKELIIKNYSHINLVNFNLEKKIDTKYFLPETLTNTMFNDIHFIEKCNNSNISKNEIIKIYDKSITGKKSQGSAVYHYNGIMSTLNAGSHGYSMGQILDPFYNKVRKLTPIECERFMGWTDNWTKYGIDDSNNTYELSDTARYKAIGNGITSIIPKVILESLIKDKEIRVFSTFSGVDGSCMQLDKKRFKIVAFSEFDPKNIIKQHASNVLKYHYPNVKNYGDITKINEKEIPDHDLMFISAPCQAFSIAGKRASLEDSRGTLFYETARILKEKKPKYALFENVKGLIIGKELETFIHMLEIYSEAGYEMDFNIFNSKFFDLPQNRERLFMFLKRKE